MKIFNPNISQFLADKPAAQSSPVSAKDKQDVKLEKLQKACKDFEAIFISFMLKSMRKASEESDLFGGGLGNDIYKEMFDGKLAEEMSRTSQFKIGDLLFNQYASLVTGQKGVEAGKGLDTSIIRQPEIKQMEIKPDMTVVEPMLTEISGRGVQSGGAKPIDHDTLSRFDHIINQAAEKYELEPKLIKAVIKHESAGDPRAVSGKGAKGLMQLIDSTAAMVGVQDPFNPVQNIMGGAKYLSMLMKRFGGDLQKALASYNAGPSMVERYDGIPPFPETRNYVRKVMSSMSSE